MVDPLKSFDEIPDNIYYGKSLGNAPGQFAGSMPCECSFKPETDPEYRACGHGSDCINRLTQIECLQGDCRCGRYCRNQRFQKKEYAPIDIFDAGPKGFGVKCTSDLDVDSFVYEYLGEVVKHEAMMRRMADYGDAKLKHFYFMMLQPNEYIDATQKGGKARFLNHSCNPNCYVAKWVVGDKLRMGIFTKRKVASGEELTFNYNADRYGHEPQQCYCGEPNCLGYIGGKTQTEYAGMGELTLRALGILELIEKRGFSKKRKSSSVDETVLPELSPLAIDEVPTMMTALRQAISTRDILVLLLERIQLTSEDSVKRRLMSLRAFDTITQILQEYGEDKDIKLKVLKFVQVCPLMHKNKIQASNLDTSVARLIDDQDEEISSIAQEVLSQWEVLESAYRIPRAVAAAAASSTDTNGHSPQVDFFVKKIRQDEGLNNNNSNNQPAFIPPTKAQIVKPSLNHRKSNNDRDKIDRSATESPSGSSSPLVVAVDDVIERTKRQVAEAEKAAAAAAAANGNSNKDEKEKTASPSTTTTKQSDDNPEKLERKKRHKEKEIKSEIGKIVVQALSEYKSHFEPEKFKKRAREITEDLVEKEKKKPNYERKDYKSLSKEQISSIKSFTRKFVEKLLIRKGIEIKKSSNGSSSHPSSSST